MDRSNGSSNSPAPFLLKTYEMVDDPLTNSVVSWSQTGHSFVVWNPPEFACELLPKYFKHNNFSSFIRQLNTYGFRKVDPEQWEFANEEFIQGHRHLLKNIHRRKPVHSHSGAVMLADSEREEYEKKIENLKQERLMLQSEVERHQEENRGYADQLRSLGEALLNIDQRQRQLVFTLVKFLQKPEHTASLVEQLEPEYKKRKVLALDNLPQKENSEDCQSVAFLENLSPKSLPRLSLEVVEKLATSLTTCEKFACEFNQISAEDMRDDSVPLLNSLVVDSETPASFGDCDLNIPSCSVSSSQDSQSSLDVFASSTCVDRQISPICIDPDSTSDVDANMSPTVTPGTESASHQDQNSSITFPTTGGNDVFWQQFLDDAPAMSKKMVAQSERSDGDDWNSDDSGCTEEHRPWWTVDKLTQQLGHLTQVERT